MMRKRSSPMMTRMMTYLSWMKMMMKTIEDEAALADATVDSHQYAVSAAVSSQPPQIFLAHFVP